MWKAGCTVCLVGLVISVGSFFFLGTAVSRALSERQVSQKPVSVGSKTELGMVTVDPDLGAKVVFETTVELPISFVEQPEGRSPIVESQVGVEYEVTDLQGRLVYQGAGNATGSTIVPEPTSPHYDSFERTVTCRHESKAFEPTGTGNLQVTVAVSPTDSRGHAVTQATVKVFDQLPGTAGHWAFGGLVSLVFGPLVILVGTVVFFVGLLTRSRPSTR